MLGWEGITEFVVVAETHSFTATAKRLGCSVAQVSRLIAGLEARLGIKLFYRTTRKVTLTEAGTLYYQHCRPLLDGLADAERAMTRLQQVPRGHLKMTAPVTFGEQRIAPLLNDFMGQYPELSVQLILTNQQLDLTEQGIDLAIRIGHLADSSMMAHKLATRRLLVCAAPAYLAQAGQPKTLADLDRHQCLLGSVEHWRFQDNGQQQSLKLSGRLRCNSGQALLDAALKGLGIVQLPDDYVRAYLESGELVALLMSYQAEEEGIWAVHPFNRQLSPKVQQLVEYLHRALSCMKAA